MLNSLTTETDRALEHSIIFACIELGEVDAIRSLLSSTNVATVRGALIALDQIPGDHLESDAALAAIGADNQAMQDTGWG
ncbi:MAG TPA: hypothetical protein DEP12_05915, partial [Planctomycetaceae bacterium]|nr:hypothetical protein [Planctomycetaceae bacterium]